MKRIKLTVFIIIVVSLIVFTHANVQELSIYIDGARFIPNDEIIIENDRTTLPMRQLFEELGMIVDWEGRTETITSQKGDTIIKLQIGNTVAYVNDLPIELDSAPFINNNKTYIPLRFVAENINCHVAYNNRWRRVDITSNDVIMHVIDVGQGDSIFLRLPQNKTMLVDAGTAKAGRTVVDYIEGLGVQKIDFLVATHPHEDHIGGMARVIENFEIGEVFMTDRIHTTKTYENLLNALENKSLAVTIPEDVLYNDHMLTINKLAPIKPNYKELNDCSIVLKITYDETALLLTGDAEKTSEEDMVKSQLDLSANLLKLGHHGSRTSTTQEFLDAVNPEMAVVSCGLGNSYGHPHEETLDKLAKRKLKLYRTDEMGSLVFKSNGKRVYEIYPETSEIEPEQHEIHEDQYEEQYEDEYEYDMAA